MSEIIRVLVAEDHTLVREGICALINAWPGMEVVAQAADGVEAVHLARALQPDVILMDLVMPRKDGIEAIKDIRQEEPDAHILVLTSFVEDERAYLAIKAGALGYLLKDSSSDDLIEAIKRVHQGEFSLHPSIALKVIRELRGPAGLPPTQDPLTEREVEVLQQVAQGLTNQEIAERLRISERTVRNHVSRILDKLHLANRTQAALYALREGYTRLP
jgi:NarL family two-component system response regulator LiaR